MLRHNSRMDAEIHWIVRAAASRLCPDRNRLSGRIASKALRSRTPLLPDRMPEYAGSENVCSRSTLPSPECIAAMQEDRPLSGSNEYRENRWEALRIPFFRHCRQACCTPPNPRPECRQDPGFRIAEPLRRLQPGPVPISVPLSVQRVSATLQAPENRPSPPERKLRRGRCLRSGKQGESPPVP